MEIVGVKCVSFVVDGKERNGFEVYLTYPKDGVDGVVCVNAYLSMRTCEFCKYMPVVGDKVKGKFRRHGSGNRLSFSWLYPVE